MLSVRAYVIVLGGLVCVLSTPGLTQCDLKVTENLVSVVN